MEFIKMHGLGNDFVILDHRETGITLSKEKIESLSDRNFGVGCDQVIIIEHSDNADAFMRIYNVDGFEAEACGNATRCVASLIMKERRQETCIIDSLGGLLQCKAREKGLVQVNMGPARAIKDMDDMEHRPVFVDMGNPHCVYFEDRDSSETVIVQGPAIEKHPNFTEGANVEFACIQGPDTIRMRVWERSVGVTMASGSGACATYAAALHRGLIGRKEIEIVMDGGSLLIAVNAQDEILMTGPAEEVFTGTLLIAA